MPIYLIFSFLFTDPKSKQLIIRKYKSNMVSHKNEYNLCCIVLNVNTCYRLLSLY